MSDGRAAAMVILLTLICGFLAIDVVIGGPIVPAPVEQTRTTWEYKITSVDDERFEGHMAELGLDGWNLVFARRASGSGDVMAYECIFKRPRPRVP